MHAGPIFDIAIAHHLNLKWKKGLRLYQDSGPWDLRLEQTFTRNQGGTKNASENGFYNNKMIYYTWCCCSVVHIIFTNAGVKVSGAAKYRPQQIQIIIISGTCSDCSYAFLMLPLITLHWSSLQQLGCVWNISKGLSYFIPEMCIMHLFDYFSELP